MQLAPEQVRQDNRRSLLYFAHHTDIHICDAQSPARLVGAQGLSWLHPGLDASHRPQETMSTHTFDQLISATNRLAQSVLSGANMAFCLQGGDHTDSGTISELQWWSQVLNGGPVSPNTGKAGIYEGVQRSQNKHVWQPDSGTTDAPSRREFPRLPGVLDSAVGPFVAEGLNVRWLSVYGNHDRIFSGMFGKSNALHLDRLADMLSSGSTAPVTTGSILRAAARAPLPARFRRGRSRIAPGFGSVEITADPAMRRTATAKDFATV
ncbi:MAG: hypothetical protein KDA95_06550, partial [Acidimicrobiales bacterium]|nr:hypothetical protein [Acidimicrobiales bacterium]